MRGTGLKKAIFQKSNSPKQGPFGIFLRKIKHPSRPLVENVLADLEAESIRNILQYQEFSTFRAWEHFKDKPAHELGESRFRKYEAVPQDIHLARRNANDGILNYYLFTKLQEEEKKKIAAIYKHRFMIPVTESFTRDLINNKKDKVIRKTDFILWMNYYLENNVSKELLELDSFEIALKLGKLWNELPFKERQEWRYLAAEDERWNDPRTKKRRKRWDIS